MIHYTLVELGYGIQIGRINEDGSVDDIAFLQGDDADTVRHDIEDIQLIEDDSWMTEMYDYYLSQYDYTV